MFGPIASDLGVFRFFVINGGARRKGSPLWLERSPAGRRRWGAERTAAAPVAVGRRRAAVGAGARVTCRYGLRARDVLRAPAVGAARAVAAAGAGRGRRGASRRSIMLKFLTHKLRTHSLNEENVSEKVEEHDSGTESDDEAERAGGADTGELCADVVMKWSEAADVSGGGEAAARPRGAPEPDQLYDHHSSEEELEVINGGPSGAGVSGVAACAGVVRAEGRRRGASSPARAAPEKRRWAALPYLDDDLAARAPSSDDDDTKVETPVRFRTSPPLEALKPRRAGGVGATLGAGAGGAEGCASPRRRRVALPPPRRHRPALDFDKMQQLKVGGGLRSWRAVGAAHGGELSVFCW
ncbi:uncharacterized protein Reph [Battus philenor]|uniref:uncharacterized protein Reph n=1 Tax=Battus philenor TaxID=42288 RepID=UPI0035CEF76E